MNKLLIQILKFGVVGGTATVIDLSIYYVMINTFKIDPLIGNIISFSFSVIYNYIASVKWVFEVTENKNQKRLFIEFIIFSILGFLLTEFTIFIGVKKLKQNSMIVKIIGTTITMVFNFITRKIFLEN